MEWNPRLSGVISSHNHGINPQDSELYLFQKVDVFHCLSLSTLKTLVYTRLGLNTSHSNGGTFDLGSL